jgi:hypothetical protein
MVNLKACLIDIAYSRANSEKNGVRSSNQKKSEQNRLNYIYSVQVTTHSDRIRGSCFRLSRFSKSASPMPLSLFGLNSIQIRSEQKSKPRTSRFQADSASQFLYLFGPNRSLRCRHAILLFLDSFLVLFLGFFYIERSKNYWDYSQTVRVVLERDNYFTLGERKKVQGREIKNQI